MFDMLGGANERAEAAFPVITEMRAYTVKDPCAFLRGQYWFDTEAAEVGDLAGKQFGMLKVRHVGRL